MVEIVLGNAQGGVTLVALFYTTSLPDHSLLFVFYSGTPGNEVINFTQMTNQDTNISKE